MLRRGLSLLIAFVALVAWLAPTNRANAAPGKSTASPAAANDSTYAAYGRVFPDPQACTKGLPGSSPWAKGKVCAANFLGLDETIAGLKFLQQKFPRFAKLVNLHDLKATVPEFAGLDMQSAGLPTTTLARNRKDLYVLVVTDNNSPVAYADRSRYAYSLSIHGIERAGIEGGIRAAEDLVTWAATEPTKHILEPTDSGPTAGEVLKNNVLYFMLSNPDGWSCGDVSQGGVFYQRYNGDGVDLNREWPGLGFSNPTYTPNVEPEAIGFGAYLRRERALAHGKPFVGALDLHGMNGAPSFSYTLLPGGGKNRGDTAKVVQLASAVYADANKRLAYSPFIAAPGSCPGPVEIPLLIGGTAFVPMCADQWGTSWDTIAYQTTGTIDGWMSSSVGLDAIGLGNEMAHSHLFPNTAFIPPLEQVHIDGNKGIIFGGIAALSAPKPAAPITLTVGYAPSVHRKVRTASVPAPSSAPAQAPIDLLAVASGGKEFVVKGPTDGVRNSGMSAAFTANNAGGVVLGTNEITLQRYGQEHEGDPVGWYDVATAYVQEATYLAAGSKIDLNDPQPGRWRIKPSGNALLTAHITFSSANAVPQPNLPYDVANTDVFNGLSDSVKPITPAAILANPHVLDGVSTYVLADDSAPGVSGADRDRWFAALKAYASNGGNLVLTDHALDALAPLGIVAANQVVKGVEYGGWISFTQPGNEEPTYEKMPLTQGLDVAGAADGSGAGLDHRRQTYDPGGLGYLIAPGTGGDCGNIKCEAPQSIVNTDAWKKAGGVVAGLAAVKVGSADEEPIGVAYGEMPVGKGRVRIAGGLLPQPTEANNHTYGLKGHGLSWTGWQVFVNLLSAGLAAPLAPSVPQPVTLIPRTGADASIPLDVAAIAVTLAALLRFARARRRLQPLS